jgi:hypothetical protein
MSFTRTNSGISNGHLFLGSDIIIYTEGGNKTLTEEEIEKGEFNEKSIDIKFWSGLFDAAEFSKKVEFRALGSKTASENIREKIIKKEISNVAVVLDRDLDFILGNPDESPYILYTKGYSWENDVYNEVNTTKQISSYLQTQNIPEDAQEDISSSFTDFKRISNRLLRLEIIFRSQNKKFITDVNGERFFNSKRSPKIDKKQLVNFIKSKKNTLKNRPATLPINDKIKNLCPMKNNYGKLMASLSTTVTNYICKKHTPLKSIPLYILESNMMERYIQQQHNVCDEYYKNIIKKLELKIDTN